MLTRILEAKARLANNQPAFPPALPERTEPARAPGPEPDLPVAVAKPTERTAPLAAEPPGPNRRTGSLRPGSTPARRPPASRRPRRRPRPSRARARPRRRRERARANNCATTTAEPTELANVPPVFFYEGGRRPIRRRRACRIPGPAPPCCSSRCWSMTTWSRKTSRTSRTTTTTRKTTIHRRRRRHQRALGGLALQRGGQGADAARPDPSPRPTRSLHLRRRAATGECPPRRSEAACGPSGARPPRRRATARPIRPARPAPGGPSGARRPR